ncbi:helix-turn-helix transcriptional regulator [Actinophytocola glycyrrhizae]|uniref:Helix-turn-helix transcriptional regulator n=1 Tax=Actinophytocola glycyrrhizae TaxID=2044873 RepID=A0ABV9RTI2_9PSEU
MLLPQPARDLAERVGTTPRTLRRDLDRLREFGYPVESTRGPGGSYRLVAGKAMPPLVLTDDEATAAVVGLRMAAPASEAADGALRKLERVLPPRLRRRVAVLSAVTHTVARQVPDLGVIGALAAAAHGRHDVRFTYRGRRGEVMERHVEPYRQVLLDRRWYLLAWDLGRADWRTFRVDRVASVAVAGSTFAPREPLPNTVVHRAEEGPRGVVRFDAPVAEVSPRLHAGSGVLEAVGEHSCRYTSPPEDWAWLAAVAAMVGVPYWVESPPELVAETERLAGRAARAAAPRSPV